MSNRQKAKSAEKRPGSNIAIKNHVPFKKNGFTRSVDKIHSAKSTSSIPRGIVFRQDQL